MNPPSPVLPPDTAQRVADTVEFFTKLAGGLAIVWAFIAKVFKPLLDWRRKRLTDGIRGALKEELECIAKLPAREETIDRKLDLAISRQDKVFGELDLFVVVVADMRERLDEMSDLLNETGHASRDRRENPELRRLADDALKELQGRLRSRGRQEDQKSMEET